MKGDVSEEFLAEFDELGFDMEGTGHNSGWQDEVGRKTFEEDLENLNEDDCSKYTRGTSQWNKCVEGNVGPKGTHTLGTGGVPTPYRESKLNPAPSSLAINLEN